MDNDPEIVRRLELLDRKLNYIAGFLIAGAALVTGTIVFFLIRRFLSSFEWGYLAAYICATIASIFVGRYFLRLCP